MLRSGQRARLEACTTPLQLIFWCVNQFSDSLIAIALGRSQSICLLGFMAHLALDDGDPGSQSRGGAGSLNHGFEPDVARFHPVLHAGRKHARSRLGIGQGHPHCHQRAGSARMKHRFNVVAGVGSGRCIRST